MKLDNVNLFELALNEARADEAVRACGAEMEAEAKMAAKAEPAAQEELAEQKLREDLAEVGAQAEVEAKEELAAEEILMLKEDVASGAVPAVPTPNMAAVAVAAATGAQPPTSLRVSTQEAQEEDDTKNIPSSPLALYYPEDALEEDENIPPVAVYYPSPAQKRKACDTPDESPSRKRARPVLTPIVDNHAAELEARLEIPLRERQVLQREKEGVRWDDATREALETLGCL
ncbi:hypothetical protein BD626DRAFT_573800 [Schizophyllum amplum]|uniref:Uncharacterized protein n=1 Tax=Schizophyllum amplum TaxID=97359 RepID=A0A550C049_9AGAR|nr:hypothetical protein BD626DRAFT_573800 [Auriculariopsis ampla]